MWGFKSAGGGGLQLWEPSFGLSYSLAPGVLNGDVINATRYAVLSNVPAPLHEDPLTPPVHQHWETELRRTGLCYNFHNTLLYPSKLWSALATMEDVADVAYRWVLTLEKRGCQHMVEAGADGVAQAMLLSFGGMKFSHSHLEFNTDPTELHRDYCFEGIVFDNATKLSIWVEVGGDNKALLYASVAQSGTAPRNPLFACDAGCLDEPVQLGSERTTFPVKQTDPLTPILYVTADRKHLEDLKHTIHVKEVVEAPALEHHVLAMHKHGHRLGGLPALFWICLVLLILTFHLFLFKLIYNEYCRDEKTSYPRGRYSV